MTHKDVIRNTYDNFFNVKDEYKSLGVNALQEICRSEARPFRMCTLNVEGDLNVGMIMRSASLFGCEQAYIFGRRRIDRRSLVGTQNYLPIVFVDGLNDDDTLSLADFKEFVDRQSSEGYMIVALEQGGVPLHEIAWKNDDTPETDKVLFVVGNESTGIPKDFLDCVDLVVSIPQVGVIRSFNVAAAANILMWDFVSKTL